MSQAPRPPSDRAQTRLSALTEWVRGLMRARGESSLRETLEDVIEEHEEGHDALAPAERDMLVNVLAIGETRVADVMVPRADVVAIDVATNLVDLMELSARMAIRACRCIAELWMIPWAWSFEGRDGLDRRQGP